MLLCFYAMHDVSLIIAMDYNLELICFKYWYDIASKVNRRLDSAFP